MNPSEMSPSESQPSPAPLPAASPVADVMPLVEPVADGGNFLAALGAGLLAAIIGASVWAAVTVTTNYKIGLMAVGVGFLVGYAIRTFGKGHTQRFAILGAVLALVGCLLGNLFTAVGFAAGQEHVGFLSILGRITPSVAVDVLQESFAPMDLVFYAIAVYEGFKLSVVRT